MTRHAVRPRLPRSRSRSVDRYAVSAACPPGAPEKTAGRAILEDLPVLGICGWSGSGKTTLIERVVPRLCAKELKVAVLKHDVHGVNVDRRGKDSDRFFQAGADVLLQGPRQEMLRVHKNGDLAGILRSLARQHDLLLLEGHKTAPFPKVWLLDSEATDPPGSTEGIVAVLPRDSDRVGALMSILDEWLPRQWLRVPVFGCVLVCGRGSHTTSFRQPSERSGAARLERTVELLGRVTEKVAIVADGNVPDRTSADVRLSNVPDAEGWTAGLLAAMRRAPHASWVVAAGNIPDLSLDILEWLLSTRAPGAWATVPKLEAGSFGEPLLAHYDFRARPLLEQLALRREHRAAEIASDSKVISPPLPQFFLASSPT